MYKLPLWHPSRYTPLQAHQWNQYLDEHPHRQHDLPVPITPNSKLPSPPYPYNKAGFYEKPPFNRKAHQTVFNAVGNAVGERTQNDEDDLQMLKFIADIDKQNIHRLNPRMEELARQNPYVIKDSEDYTPFTQIQTIGRKRNSGSSGGSGYDSSKSNGNYSVMSDMSELSKRLFTETPRRNSGKSPR